MSMEDILIHRDFPIINGFVQVPPNHEGKTGMDSIYTANDDKARVTTAEAQAALTGETVTRLSMGSGKSTGWRHGQQEWLRLVGLKPVGAAGYTNYTTDPVTSLASS